ncbi:hypothetical protein [Streptomyces sp. 1331.2]|uniref:hypothetical protein n=1 Tax=Streptomyces sp. 1331.2 TaxID=1938835 RepID=UPI000BD85831|nr:hypothetical protein [Streptomyces sp. 1331.2]SOB81234.1 Biotin carboxylase [Streptomyces sp. 1331.2]
MEQSSAEVLLLGWYEPALTALTELGAHVVNVLDPRDLHKARALEPSDAVRFLTVPDTRSSEEVVSGLARHGLTLSAFSHVCSMRELSVVTAAVLAAVGGCASLDVPTAIAVRDKFVQKQLVRAAGVPVTACRVVDLLTDLTVDGWDRPVVVKPLAGGGSRDTHVLADPQSLARLLAEAPEPPRGPWLVEDFVAGTELHVDGVVRAGRVQWFAVSRYLTNVIDIKAGVPVGSVVLEPAGHPGLYAATEALLQESLDALGHREGIFHLEMFERDGALTFSECAGRVGGAMIRESIRYRFGVDLPGEWARAALGLPMAPVPADRPEVCGWMQFSAPAGRVVEVPDVAAVLAQPGCVEAIVSLTKGATVPDISAASNLKAGSALVVGDTEEQVQARMLALSDWFARSVTTEAEPCRPS